MAAPTDGLNPIHVPKRGLCGSNAASVCAALIAVVWIVSGTAKLLNLDAFREIVLAHGVIERGTDSVVFLVPVLELALGITLGLFGGSRQRPRASVTLASLSVVSLVVFTVYLSRVPAEVLEAVGCGCHGAARLERVDMPYRHILLVTNASLIALHTPLFLTIIRGRMNTTPPATVPSPSSPPSTPTPR